jgi:hypothetical protein
MARLVARVRAALGPRLPALELALPAVGAGVDVAGRVLHFVAVALAHVVRARQLPAAVSAARPWSQCHIFVNFV